MGKTASDYSQISWDSSDPVLHLRQNWDKFRQLRIFWDHLTGIWVIFAVSDDFARLRTFVDTGPDHQVSICQLWISHKQSNPFSYTIIDKCCDDTCLLSIINGWAKQKIPDQDWPMHLLPHTQSIWALPHTNHWTCWLQRFLWPWSFQSCPRSTKNGTRKLPSNRSLSLPVNLCDQGRHPILACPRNCLPTSLAFLNTAPYTVKHSTYHGSTRTQ